jgi:multiple antibiotic resistance protein
MVFVKAAVAIFVILSPFSNIPVVVGLTRGMDSRSSNRVVLRAHVTALFIALAFAVAGELIFQFFQITIGAFRIAGGILLFILSLSMLYGETPKSKLSDKDQEEAQGKEDVAITPLGTPMIAGPGTIATIMSVMDQAKGWDQKGITLAAVPVAVAASYLCIRLGAPLTARVGAMGLRVLTRMMGLILAVMAVQFVINGLRDALPQILPM